MIIGEVRRYLRDNNTIRVSRSVRDLAYKALQAREKLSKVMAKEPSVEEIAAAVNQNSDKIFRPEDIVNALEAITDPISLFEPVYNDGGSSDSVYVMDQVSDTGNTDEAWLEDIALQEAMRKLNEREKTIIRMRFYKGKTQMEIADEIGISNNKMTCFFEFVRRLSGNKGSYKLAYTVTDVKWRQ